MFSFIYFTVSVVSQQDKYEIVTETHPFKNTYPAPTSKKLACTKIQIYNFTKPPSDEIK